MEEKDPLLVIKKIFDFAERASYFLSISIVTVTVGYIGLKLFEIV